MKKEKSISSHILYGCHLSLWKKLKSENIIDNAYKNKKRRISFLNLLTFPLKKLQSLLYRRKIDSYHLDESPPIFIIGHWRSGTTHLHYLMNADPQLNTATNYHMFLYNLAFLSKNWLKIVFSCFFPDKRPQDNIKISPNAPAEEEQGFCTMSACSGLHSFSFPKNKSYFEKYNLFKNITLEEKQQWEKDYKYLIQSIALYHGNKNLVLKNPHNTGRMKELSCLFPDSKFIYIHRDPYDVYQSTRYLFKKIVETQFLQRFSEKEIEDFIIENFKNTTLKYLKDKKELNPKQLIELSYQELNNTPIKTVKEIYQYLNIPNFSAALAPMKNYLDSVKEYKKNEFNPTSKHITKKINVKMDFYFKEFNYKKR